MNLNNLYYFKVMAEFQHYTRAAQSLFITQPSLSHAMSSLERELGVRLFEKEGRNVKLTKYGHLLKSYVTPGFREIEAGDRLLRQFSKKNSGIVDFSFLFVLGQKFVPEMIKNFYLDDAHKNITIHFNQCNTKTTITRIKDNSVDLGLCTFMPDEPDVKFKPIIRQDLICIVSLNHPLAKKASVTPDELGPYPLIRYIDTAGEIQSLIDHMLADCSVEPETLYHMAEEITMAGMVSSGHRDCVAVVPDLDILEHYAIRKIPLKHPDAYRNIFLATSKKHPLPPCVRTLYDFALAFAGKAARDTL